jgi:hypothetical protein
MTAQNSDIFLYKGESYALIGSKNDSFLDPERQFGMVPTWMHTACHRGFYATIEITNNEVLLRKLTIREENDHYPPIGGVVPKVEPYKEAIYENLAVPISFTGEIRLGTDFQRELYVHMGYQGATSFNTVLDITIENSKVVEVVDRSEEMQKQRSEINTKREEDKKKHEEDMKKQSNAKTFFTNLKLKWSRFWK